jgi:hypothetical protein
MEVLIHTGFLEREKKTRKKKTKRSLMTLSIAFILTCFVFFATNRAENIAIPTDVPYEEVLE